MRTKNYRTLKNHEDEGCMASKANQREKEIGNEEPDFNGQDVGKEEVEDEEEGDMLTQEEKEKFEQEGMEVSSGFRPGMIHEKEAREYWRDNLKAPDMIMSILTEGYKLPFIEIPSYDYEEENNRSARDNKEFVRETIEAWQRQGVIQFVSQKPRAVSPLSVAIRKCPDGSLKRRLCWDGSRFMNKKIKKEKVNLAHLQTALEITEAGDWQCKYDLSNAYFHIKIHEEHRTFLGACLYQENGKKQYFQFNFLPFGLASAVHVMTKIMKPLQAYFGKLGIRHSIFIDDGRVVAGSREQAQEDYKTVLEVLSRSGWQIAKQKSDELDGASQVKEYLGFQIDSANMTVSLTEDKKLQLRQLAKELASSAGRSLKTKDLASMIGKVAATEPALGNFSRIMTRRAYYDLDKAVLEWGWSGKIQITEEVASDFQTLAAHLEEYDHTPIRSKATEMSVVAVVGPPSDFLKKKTLQNHKAAAQKEVWCGDASAEAVCAYSVTSGQPFFFKKRLSEEESKLSSGYRELMTVKYALHYLESNRMEIREQKTIYWITDSENLVTFLTKGSTKKHIRHEH